MSLKEIRERAAKHWMVQPPYFPGYIPDTRLLTKDAHDLLALLDEAREALEEQVGECRISNEYGDDCRSHFDDGEVGKLCWTYPCAAVRVLKKLEG